MLFRIADEKREKMILSMHWQFGEWVVKSIPVCLTGHHILMAVMSCDGAQNANIEINKCQSRKNSNESKRKN